MVNLADREQLVTFLKDQRLWLKREASQHFLVDTRTVEATVSAADLAADDVVLEIGPGVGTLTHALAEEVTAGLVLAVEYDVRFVKLLRDAFKHNPHVKVVHADALKFAFQDIQPGPRGVKVVANLPYHLTGALLRQLMDPALCDDQPSLMVLMMQREVAERLLAPPGSSARGMPTVLAELYGTVTAVAEVPRMSFFPPPEVDSMVVKFVRHRRPLAGATGESVLRLAKAGFAAKRRTLANALAGSLAQPKQQVADWLAAAKIPLLARAEDLDLASWQKLLRAISIDLAL